MPLPVLFSRQSTLPSTNEELTVGGSAPLRLEHCDVCPRGASAVISALVVPPFVDEEAADERTQPLSPEIAC